MVRHLCPEMKNLWMLFRFACFSMFFTSVSPCLRQFVDILTIVVHDFFRNPSTSDSHTPASMVGVCLSIGGRKRGLPALVQGPPRKPWRWTPRIIRSWHLESPWNGDVGGHQGWKETARTCQESHGVAGWFCSHPAMDVDSKAPTSCWFSFPSSVTQLIQIDASCSLLLMQFLYKKQMI